MIAFQKVAMLLGSVCILMSCGNRSTDTNAYLPDSGNVLIDRFVSSVQRGDREAVAGQIAKFETISGLFPQFASAGEYLSWTDGCRISRAGQNGLDGRGNVVAIDVSLRSGPPAADVIDHVYWIDWVCSKGKFRQALNADFEAPKIMVGEMIAETRAAPLPVMRPPLEE